LIARSLVVWSQDRWSSGRGAWLPWAGGDRLGRGAPTPPPGAGAGGERIAVRWSCRVRPSSWKRADQWHHFGLAPPRLARWTWVLRTAPAACSATASGCAPRFGGGGVFVALNGCRIVRAGEPPWGNASCSWPDGGVVSVGSGRWRC